MSITPQEFRAALGRFTTGVTVVTTIDGQGRLHGITVSAFSSVSLQPPLVLVCIEKNTGSHYAFVESRRFVVNILSESQQHISLQFASHIPNKFAGIEFYQGIDGIPVLAGALANLECRLTSSYEAGDHTIFVGEIENSVVRQGKPLVYFQGNYRKLEN
jgi:flavin reductase (DIM6/NTAB) family NADH-FMN oxidoreductase RutF